ncbi:MAG: tyrosine-type recombinase/integrase [Helicobacteraceae bacterium]|jgi:integrase/recombinase XerC|nr:tyrosine-type recombinase/integrase [Helicobacteraceae bacterium]
MSITESSRSFTNGSLTALIDKFLDYLQKNRGRGALTIKVYKAALKAALKVAIVDEKLKTIDFMPYRETIENQAPKTIAKNLSAIRSFLSYLEAMGWRFHAYALESVKVPKSLPKPAAHKQIVEALDAASGENAILIELLYGLGLRISEAASLRVENIGANFLRVKGKGNKTREIPIFDSLKDKIDRYLAQKAPARFFFEEKGKPLSDNQLRYKVARSFKEIGLKIAPHQLRHSFATEMLNGGARIADVSEILGHSQLATTEIYTKLSTSMKLKSYIAAHPLCKETGR